MRVREFKFFRGIIQARIIRAEWSPELENELIVSHNVDLESEMTNLLSQEISRQIDDEILTRLFNDINNTR